MRLVTKVGYTLLCLHVPRIPIAPPFLLYDQRYRPARTLLHLRRIKQAKRRGQVPVHQIFA